MTNEDDATFLVGPKADSQGCMMLEAGLFIEQPLLLAQGWLLAAISPESVDADTLTKLVDLMRRVGIEHFVAASDWPVEGGMREYYKRLGALPLTKGEWRKVRK